MEVTSQGSAAPRVELPSIRRRRSSRHADHPATVVPMQRTTGTAANGGVTVYPSVRDVPTRTTSLADRRARVGGTVLALGGVSFLTDISSEMVTAVLPVYLTVVLGLSPF